MSTPDQANDSAPTEAPHAAAHEQYQCLQPGSYTDQKLVGRTKSSRKLAFASC